MMENVEVQKGVITRIYVKNFVTYDEVTVRPGRNLNLIIGPNGTGKSTIVCAIVLGLGGSTKVIGRANNIADFVKYGQNDAIVEIDLQNDNGKCVTIKRCFNTKGHSTWSVNNKTTNVKQVTELMKSFNIQVDNLCQFLPQDKVQDFSKLQAPELLIETERSVGDPKLLEYHNKLIQLRKQQAELEKQLESSSKIFNNDKQVYDSLKDSVGHINEQKLIKKKLKHLKQKRAWMLFQSKREEFEQAKKGRDEAAAKMKKIEKDIEPVKQKIAKIKSSIQALEKTAKQHQSETSAKRNKLTKFRDEVDKYEKSVNETEAQCKEEIRAEKECDDRINQLLEDKSKLENDITQLTNDVGQLQEINEKLNAINVEMNKDRNTLNGHKTNENYFKQQIDHNNRKIRAEEQSLKEVYNIENKRLDMLRKLSNDAYKGVLWLRENKHLFSKPIHEPMILSINLKDPSYSKYFENIIAARDLTAFVCEDKRDMNSLVTYLRVQQKLKINAVHSDPDKNVNTRPRIPLENIQQFGFNNYLSSLIEAPKTIMNYIITMYRINDIPIGSDHVANHLERIPDSLNRFFSPTNLYNVSKSKYTHEKSTRQQNVTSRGYLSITIDNNKIKRIEEDIAASKEKVNALVEELHKCQEEIIAMSQKIESQKGERNRLQTNQSKMENLTLRISLIGESIEKEKSNRKNIDDIQAQFKKKIQGIIKQQLVVYNTYNKMQEECFKNAIKDEEMKLDIKLKKNELAVLENDSQELMAELSDAERNFKNLDNELNPLKVEVQELYAAAKETTDGLCYDSPEFQPYKTIFAKLPPSMEEIVTEIQTTQAKIFTLRNDQSEANRILQQFNNAKKNMERMDAIIKEHDGNLTKVTEEITKIKDEWYPALSALVDKINSNFSNYFLKMRCAGEVLLCNGDNSMDFEKYGLKIRVKFRDADELQTLTRNHQSGGERAVTTAVYMIALQELTRVPFRCVDEINQGMDATNERRIFELIVNITSKSNSAQYFLLTPKLLPNLKYNETITVLTVYNGRYMIPCSKFDINRDCNSIVNAVLRRQGAEC